MTKLCPRGKAAAKRKFKVYPSAYANAYASKICAGKIKDPSGVKRKDFRGPKKAMGGRIMTSGGGDLMEERRPELIPRKQKPGKGKAALPTPRDQRRPELKPKKNRAGVKMKDPISPTERRDEDAAMKRESRLSTKIRGYNERVKRAGGGLMEATARLKRQGLKGGGICTKGMNRDAVGKNS